MVKEEKKEEVKELKQPQMPKPKFRQLIVETDGTSIRILKSEVSTLELKEICRTILKQTGGV